MWTIIQSVYATVPETKVTSTEMEEKISRSFPYIPKWILEEMTWVQTRYFVSDWQYPSDLAIEAWEKCIQDSSLEKDDIDLLIFASASQDITEPATANIVQKWLWLGCSVFDIKNACNSFLNAIDIADGLIRSGKYKNILIVSGETPSTVIKFWVKNRSEFKNHFAGYTLWDAGAAMVMSSWEKEIWIQYSYFYSDGNTWDLATVMWWGSRYPRQIDKTYFTGDPWKMRDKFVSIGADEFERWIQKLWWKREEIQKIFVHQVAMSNFKYMSDILQMESSKFEIILPDFGNIASCCIPMSFFQYKQKGWSFQSGDRFVFIGFASWFSYGLIFYEV